MIRLIQKSTIVALLLFSMIAMSQNKTSKIDEFDVNGKTQLLNAISSGDNEKVRELIKSGASVNTSEKNGLKGTPLMYASSLGNLEVCKLLLVHGAKINALDINHDHALNWATFSGKKNAMNLLIEHGADVSQKSKHGKAVDVALRLWHHDSIVDVFRTTKIAESISKNDQKFISAVQQKNLNVLQKLLKRGVSPNLKDEVGVPVLQLAAQAGGKSLVEFLVDNGAEVNCTNRVGQTPLSWAARYGHINVVEFLINNGANVNKTDGAYALTPLIGAAVGGSSKVGEILLNKGAKINHKDIINNASALHWALFYNNDAFAKLLVKNGANYHEKALTDNLHSAYDMVKSYKKKNILQLMDSLDLVKNRKDLKGSWNVQEIHYEYPDTTYVMKTKNEGRFLFSSHRYSVMYNPMMQQRSAFKNLSNPTKEEILKAFQSIVFNTGSFEFEDDVIHTTADIAKVPGFEGGHQYYRMQFEAGNLKSLTLYDEIYPNGMKPEWIGKIKVRFLLKKEL